MSTNENKSGRPKKESNPFNDIFRKLIGTATQQEAADKIGVSRQNVGRWISGDTTPDINTLIKIADAYDVSTDYLLGRTPNKTTDIELQAVCEYLGLSEKAVDFLHKLQLFAKGKLKSDLYYDYLKKRDEANNALLNLYKKYPEMEQMIEKYDKSNNRKELYDEYIKKHPFFEKAFTYFVITENEDDIGYALRWPVEEAEKNLMVLNVLLSTEKIWDLTHLLVIYFFTDFTKGTITTTVTSEDYGTTMKDGGRSFTFTRATLENGMLSEITDIIKSLKNQCGPKYRLCDVMQEENFEASHNMDYLLKHESIFNNKEGENNG